MSLSCGFASSQMEVMRERVDGSGKVPLGDLVTLLLALLLSCYALFVKPCESEQGYTIK